MRPDPYKQARSRQYLARQRAKHGKQAATKEGEGGAAEATHGRRLPRWLRNLPSNLDRYQDDAEGQEELMGMASPGALVSLVDYDFARSEDINRLVEEFTLGGSAAPSWSADAAGLTSCPLYDQLTGIDVARLEQVAAAGSDDEFGEGIELPDWFLRHRQERASSRNVGSSGGPLPRPSLPSLSEAVSQSRSKTSSEGRDGSDTSPPEREAPRASKRPASEGLLDSILDA